MFKITFDFDPDTKRVLNVKVVDNSSKKYASEVDVELTSNKLKLSDTCITKLSATPGDRIAIQYWTENNTLTYPLIGKAECFTDKDGGNKLSKTNTVSFRGTQASTLTKYGEAFKLEEFDKIEGAFKLVPVAEAVENAELKEEEQDLDNLSHDEIDTEIESLFETKEDLPF